MWQKIYIPVPGAVEEQGPDIISIPQLHGLGMRDLAWPVEPTSLAGNRVSGSRHEGRRGRSSLARRRFRRGVR